MRAGNRNEICSIVLGTALQIAPLSTGEKMKSGVVLVCLILSLLSYVSSFVRGYHSSGRVQRGTLERHVLQRDNRLVSSLANNDEIEKQTPRVKKQNKRDKMLAAMFEDTEFLRPKVSSAVPLAEDPLVPMIEDIIRAADKRKAKNMKAIRIEHLTEVTTFMVIVEGNSRPQNQAIANAIEEEVLLNHQEQPTKEGDAASGWVLLDYASVIVHIMTPQMRNFYKLEKRWKDAEEMNITPLLLPDVATGGSYDSSEDNEFFENVAEEEEEDPFWQ